MAEPSPGWWWRRRSQPKELDQVPAEPVSHAGHAAPPTAAATAPQDGADDANDSELNAILERIVDRTAASWGRHVKVSHSGRFKEKKRVRATLGGDPKTLPGADGTRNENQMTGN